MRRMIYLIGALVLLCVFCVIVINLVPGSISSEKFQNPSARELDSSNSVSILVWNVGYAGLGREADFVADGGEQNRPEEKRLVQKNLDGIAQFIEERRTDIVLLQEVAEAGFMTRSISVLDRLAQLFQNGSYFFSADVRTRLLPQSISFRHGLFSATSFRIQQQSTHRISKNVDTRVALLPRLFHIQKTLFEVSGERWALLNVHLSAFDKGGELRKEQLKEVLEIATGYYNQGYCVVIGGDFNLRLTATDFGHTSEQSALFWISDFPASELPVGWQLAVDEDTATVRTNERPYEPGENYTTIIDGAIISPNAILNSVQAHDLGFEFSDHNPVLLDVSCPKK